MKAAYIVAHGGPEVLRVGERPDPVPGPGQVVVRLHAAALNHLDLWVRDGIPGVHVDFPRILGADGAGTILELGPEAEGQLRRRAEADAGQKTFAGEPGQKSLAGEAERRTLTVGDPVVLLPGLFCGTCEFCARGAENLCIRYRLIGEHSDGTLAERIAVPATNVFLAPEPLSWEESAAFPLVYLTAWRMVRVRGRLVSGEMVLIHGIGGGVSSAALQIAVDAGGRVLVTSSAEEKLSRALELGAERAVNYRTGDVREAVREWTAKRGVDLVIDSVGGPAWSVSLDAAARSGRIVTCGATAGDDPPARIRRIFWKQVDVLGSTMGNRQDFQAVLRKFGEGDLKPIVDRVFPLEEAGAALARLESGEQFGKVVLRIA